MSLHMGSVKGILQDDYSENFYFLPYSHTCPELTN